MFCMGIWLHSDIAKIFASVDDQEYETKKIFFFAKLVYDVFGRL